MTRRSFGGLVNAPRPAAAWLMSLVASGTLWITGLLPVWVIAVQGVAFLISFATRQTPPAFRRNPVWLNIGMLGITTVTIRSALAGNPAMISLAFFTALAQALQLMDARPRRSEFLLVALALFQVILASNLTDSILFPPLLLLFLISVTWTLLVHTLQIEAADANDPGAASRVIRTDLIRMTTTATCGCVALALLLFMILPRVETNMLRGGLAGGLAISGFSDHVELGKVGRIRKDHSTVLRVESLSGEIPDPADAYWRGLAFDRFDGRSWSISGAERSTSRRRVSGIGRFGIVLEPESSGEGIAQRIVREPVDSGVLFTPGQAQRIRGRFQRIERDSNGSIYLSGPSEERIRYSVWARRAERRVEVLRLDHALSPLESAPGGRRPADRYLALPELDPRLSQLASQIVGSETNDFDRALRLEQQLRQIGRYTDDPAPLGDADSSPIEAFLLGEIEGHCEYFASAMVVLARLQGLPARLVNGFAGGVPNSVGEFVEVTRADAHTWVEIHFDKAGWVRFDPTPPDRRLRARNRASLWTRVTDFGSAAELWWFQRVVDFDRADPISTLRELWWAWKGDPATGSDSTAEVVARSQRSRDWSSRLARTGPWLLAASLAAALVALQLARRRSARDLPEAYHQALRLLARKGLHRAAATSARDFSNQFREALPGKAALAFERITESYLAERFGNVDAPELNTELAILECAIDRMGLRDQPHVG